MSQPFHDLIHHLAKARLVMPTQHERIGKKSGKILSDSALQSIYTGYLRRQFSFCAVQAQTRLLLDRLDLLTGGESGSTARRRQAADYIEFTAGREREAQRTAARQGRVVVR